MMANYLNKDHIDISRTNIEVSWITIIILFISERVRISDAFYICNKIFVKYFLI